MTSLRVEAHEFAVKTILVVAASRLPLWAHQHDQTGDYDAEQAMEVLTE